MADTDDQGWVLPGEKSAAPVGQDGWVLPGDKNKPVPKPYIPQGGFFSRLNQNYRDARLGALDEASKPGVLNKAAGALGYVASPIDALSKSVLGDPMYALGRAAGLPDSASRMLGETGSIGGQVFGAGPAASMAREAPAIARELAPLVGKAGEVIGGAGRTALDVAQGMFDKAMAGRQATKDAAAAAKAPSRDAIAQASQDAFKEAKAAGANVRPEVFDKFADSMTDVQRANEIISGDIPISEKIYTNTKDLVDRLEDYKGHELTLQNLMTLQREANGFVKKALTAAGDDLKSPDVRGTKIIEKQIRNFVDNLKPEDVSSGNPEKAVAALNKAKELYRRQSKMDSIQNIVDVAKTIRDPNYIQQQFKAIVKDPGEYERFSDAERKLIDEIAANTRAKYVGRVLPFGHKATELEKATRMEGSGGRLDKAEQLIDMIAKGEAAQVPKPTGPGMGAQTMGAINKGAGAIGGVARSGADAAEDILKNLLRRRPP